jgi:zinc and cadmium transporter
VHNLVDGVLVAAAFLTDFHLGVVTTFAVLSHEIPQELGDVVLLLRSGFGRRRALWFNLLSALPAVAGGVFAYYTLVDAMQAVPFVLAIAASSFIYIAMADLIPALHRRTSALATTEQLVLIAAGILVVAMGHGLAH